MADSSGDGGVAAGPGTATSETPGPQAQSLRLLAGRFALARVSDAEEVLAGTDLLAVVFGPDGGAAMRRDDAAEDGWVALWNGDNAHDPEATGMLAAIVAPLAAGQVPVWTAASYDGDLVLVPARRLTEAADVLRRAGHQVVR